MPYKDKNKALLKGREYYWKHRDRILKIRSQQPYDPTIKHNRHLKTRYGITLDDYEKMFKLQQGVCKICSKPQVGGRRLHVDHDHSTGHVRGLLCYGCNSSLGRFEKYMQQILAYLHA